MGCGRTRFAGAANRMGSYKVAESFAKQLREGVGARDCLDDRYRVPAHNGGHWVTQRKTHNSHSHACTLHQIEKAYNNGQEVTMLENPNIVAGTDVDTHTYPLPLTNLDS